VNKWYAVDSQGDDICVGSLDSDIQGVVTLLVHLCLRRPPLQEQTDLPAEEKTGGGEGETAVEREKGQ